MINSECKRIFCRVEGVDAHWRLYRLPVVTVRAEPQEGDGTARAWIKDPKVYPGIPFVKLSTKIHPQKFKKKSNIHQNAKIL